MGRATNSVIAKQEATDVRDYSQHHSLKATLRAIDGDTPDPACQSHNSPISVQP